MAWVKVQQYSFGFSTADKKFWMYYILDGIGTPTQVFLTSAEVTAIAELFKSTTAVNYETTGKYFATAPRTL